MIGLITIFKYAEKFYTVNDENKNEYCLYKFKTLKYTINHFFSFSTTYFDQ